MTQRIVLYIIIYLIGVATPYAYRGMTYEQLQTDEIIIRGEDLTLHWERNKIIIEPK